MRFVAKLPAENQDVSGLERMMMVTTPQQRWVDPGQGVLFAYHVGMGEDGPCSCQWPITDIEYAKRHLKKFGIPVEGWVEIPDQLAGCLDDWIEPVRITRESEGGQPRWERYIGGGWVPFDGPSVSVVYPPT